MHNVKMCTSGGLQQHVCFVFTRVTVVQRDLCPRGGGKGQRATSTCTIRGVGGARGYEVMYSRKDGMGRGLTELVSRGEECSRGGVGVGVGEGGVP